MPITQGSVTIDDDGTENKSGASGALYDILRTTAEAQAAAFGQTLPTGADGVPAQRGLADIANDHAEWLADQVATAAINDLGTVSGGTVTFDLSLGTHHKVILGANSILAFSNQIPGTEYVFHLIQDATGNRTGNFLSVGKFRNGTTDGTLSTAGNAHDVYAGVSDGTSIWFHAVAKDLV